MAWYRERALFYPKRAGGSQSQYAGSRPGFNSGPGRRPQASERRQETGWRGPSRHQSGGRRRAADAGRKGRGAAAASLASAPDRPKLSPMLRLTRIIGIATEPAIAERLHALDHDGRVETIALDAADTARKRLRVATDKGTDCAIALARSERLVNGAVLLLEPARAVVVRMRETTWLALGPRDLAAALELGYFCGNLHWRVRFEDAVLKVALDGPRASYMARLAQHLEDGRARLVDEPEDA